MFLVSLELQSDEEICFEELQTYKSFFNTKKDTIIKAAAGKLEKSGKYDEDLTKISAAIVRIFPGFSSSTISIALDEKYKRAYNQKEEQEPKEPKEQQTPKTKFEEFVFILQDNFKTFDKLTKTIIKRAQADPDLQQEIEETFTQTIHDFHDNIEQFIQKTRMELFEIEDIDGLITYTKRMQVEIKLLDKYTDTRSLLDPSMKFGLKLQFAQDHFKTIGKKLSLSNSWLSKHDSDLETKLWYNQLTKCPECDFNYRDFINKAKLAQDTGVEMPEYNKTIHCSDCGSTNLTKETKTSTLPKSKKRKKKTS